MGKKSSERFFLTAGAVVLIWIMALTLCLGIYCLIYGNAWGGLAIAIAADLLVYGGLVIMEKIENGK
ncbi:MAG: hypothetical protein E7467_05235 [Ruminococcaceae bacterium]|nr:hypothetical protein [Oscillospiraceae bacterium]